MKERNGGHNASHKTAIQFNAGFGLGPQEHNKYNIIHSVLAKPNSEIIQVYSDLNFDTKEAEGIAFAPVQVFEQS